jgi:hypothetical protein
MRARGSLEIRYKAGYRGAERGKNMDVRACRCSPTVRARFPGVPPIKIGFLQKGWAKADLEPFETELAKLRGSSQTASTSAPSSSAPSTIIGLAGWT